MKLPRRIFCLFNALIIAVVLSWCPAENASAQAPQGDYEPVKKYLAQYITREMRSHHIVGLSIGLVDDQNLVWAQGFGYSDKEKGVKADARTIYFVGSISKLFTASSVMQLGEQGKINIDMPLQTYLPEFSIQSRFPEAGPITPRNMMTHDSGLPSDICQGWANIAEARPETDILPLLKETYVASPPGFAWSYSNLAFNLLGQMVARVSGEDFVAYTDAHLFGPMGMSDSSFELKPHMQPLLAQSYAGRKAREPGDIRDVAAGDLYSSVEDLARFVTMVFAGGKAGDVEVLKPDTLQQMLSVQNAAVKLDVGREMGLGWFMDNYFCLPEEAGPTAWHAGAVIYHRTVLITLPGQKIGVIVLANSVEGSGVVNSIGCEAIRAMLKAKTGIDAGAPRPQPDPGPDEPVELDLQQYAGYYDSQAYGLFEIRADRNRLNMIGGMARVLPLVRVYLVPGPGGSFAVEVKMLGIFPVDVAKITTSSHGMPFAIRKVEIYGRELEGLQTLVMNINGLEQVAAVKLEPAPIPEIWMNRMGQYLVTDQGDNLVYFSRIDLKAENDLVVAEMKAVAPTGESVGIMALKPLSDTDAVIMGIGRDRGETIRFIQDGEGEIMTHSGFHFRQVK